MVPPTPAPSPVRKTARLKINCFVVLGNRDRYSLLLHREERPFKAI